MRLQSFQRGAWHPVQLKVYPTGISSTRTDPETKWCNAMHLRPCLQSQMWEFLQEVDQASMKRNTGVCLSTSTLCGVSKTASTRIFGEYQNKPHLQGGFCWASCFEQIIYLPPREEMTRFTHLSKYCLTPHFLDFNKEYNFEHTKKNHFKYLVGRSRCDVFLTQSSHFQWVDKNDNLKLIIYICTLHHFLTRRLLENYFIFR